MDSTLFRWLNYKKSQIKRAQKPSYRYWLFLFSCLIYGMLSAQAPEDLDLLSYADGLKKGKFFISFGFNFNQEVTKNQDELIYYILDDSNKRYNFKFGAGYNIRDRKSVGLAIRYFYDEYNVIYENVISDTFNSRSIDKKLVTSITYGNSASLFNSKRLFFISDPSLFFGIGNSSNSRELDGIMEISGSESKWISLGIHVGIQLFLNKNLSVQSVIGPIGVGYQWDSYTLDDLPNGTSSSFFARTSPNIFNLEPPNIIFHLSILSLP